MSKIKCDENCFECPYPDVPAKCLARPIEPWEGECVRAALNERTPADRRKRKRESNRIWAQKRRAEKRYAADQACIAEARKKRGLLQNDLAERIGINKVTLCTWEKGVAHANWDKLCAVLPELEEYRPKGGNNGDRI